MRTCTEIQSFRFIVTLKFLLNKVVFPSRMAKSLSLKWKRPKTTEYPKVWHTFKARDLDSDELVEYRIQDLPLDRLDEIIEFMFNNYIVDEPIGQVLGKFSALSPN